MHTPFREYPSDSAKSRYKVPSRVTTSAHQELACVVQIEPVCTRTAGSNDRSLSRRPEPGRPRVDVPGGRVDRQRASDVLLDRQIENQRV
eukprot:2275175-Pleurochrysis_carterae.AAC.1